MKKYDSYKDSGIEWIGEIPSHWVVNKLFRLFKINTGFTPSTSNSEYYENGIFDWINISDLETKYVSRSKTKLTMKAIEGKDLVPKGSLLYSFKLSVGKMAFAEKDLYTNEAIFSIYPDEHINLNYYYYLLDRVLIHNSNENIYGAKILNQELIKASKLIVPTKSEQTAIANYLDKKTTQIDDLIAKKERLIQLLEEERTAIINQAMTKGLDPTVLMKDSGIEWLGEIPAHWEVKSFRFCIDVLTDYTANGSFASLAENVTYYESGYSRLVRLTDLRVNLENEGLYVDEHAHHFLKKSELFGGELLIANVGAYAGLVMQMPRVAGKFTLGPNMFLLRLNQNTDFFISQLNAPFCAEQLKVMAVSSAQPKLNKENIRQLKVVTPPIEEQKEIVEHLQSKSNELEIIANKTKQEIELLKEYKTALISEVVTGKVDVRNENLN
jgi:type I restriction enzyme S subunit